MHKTEALNNNKTKQNQAEKYSLCQNRPLKKFVPTQTAEKPEADRSIIYRFKWNRLQPRSTTNARNPFYHHGSKYKPAHDLVPGNRAAAT